MDYQKIVDYRNNNNPYAKRLGIVVQEIGPGYARVTKTVEPEDCNPIGKTHGGVYFSMADTACGSAAASYGYLAVTVSSQYNFLRSAVPGWCGRTGGRSAAGATPRACPANCGRNWKKTWPGESRPSSSSTAGETAAWPCAATVGRPPPVPAARST